MTTYLLIALTSLLLSSQNVFNKEYQRRTSKVKSFLFVTYTSLAAFLFYLVGSGFNLDFKIGILPYSVAFGVCYGITFISTVFALRTGSLALTNLVTSFSLLIPTVYGLIFLQEPMGKYMILGLVLLFFAIILLNIPSKQEKIKVSFKWCIFAALAFFGNGMCVIVQNMQQKKFDGGFKNETMMLAVLVSALIVFVGAVINGELKRNNDSCKKDNLSCALWGTLTGLANGGVNLLVMVLTGGVTPIVTLSLFNPGLSACSMVIAFFVSLLIYRERFSKSQMLGYAVSVLSIIFLNL